MDIGNCEEQDGYRAVEAEADGCCNRWTNVTSREMYYPTLIAAHVPSQTDIGPCNVLELLAFD